ncbi:UDP-N-acetylmuramoyl-L-alanyl-D-glutamate--2,6-diaminopimelate ligase [Desulfobacterota bacterium M19]
MNTLGLEQEKRLLTDLVRDTGCQRRSGSLDKWISGLVCDSREAGPGMLFAALPGSTVDGHEYAVRAAAGGCTALLLERGRKSPSGVPAGVTVLETDNTRRDFGLMAAAFYGNPGRRLCLIGITGTNGKTTSTYLLEAILRKSGANPGVIGTINYRFNGRETPASLTTPDAVHLQRLLKAMADGGVTHVIMEMSSHAIAQERLSGCEFEAVLFTNLSRDHLDFHGSMDNYFAVKQRAFRQLTAQGRAVVVIGPAVEGRHWGRELVSILEKDLHKTGQAVITCGQEPGLSVRVRKAEFSLDGIKAELMSGSRELTVLSPMHGRFNLQNILGAAGTALALGTGWQDIAGGLAATPLVPGRLERVRAGGDTEKAPAVFVDYAHTPDALRNVLQTLRPLTGRRLVLVFGCGGDRDQGKRFLMGRIGGELADVVIITSDNSRSEEPLAIMREIGRGVREFREPERDFFLIEDRAQAIAQAIGGAGDEDVVLISGKGHEDYQLSRNGRIFFDDRLQARQNLALWSKK